MTIAVMPIRKRLKRSWIRDLHSEIKELYKDREEVLPGTVNSRLYCQLHLKGEQI